MADPPSSVRVGDHPTYTAWKLVDPSRLLLERLSRDDVKLRRLYDGTYEIQTPRTGSATRRKPPLAKRQAKRKRAKAARKAQRP